MRDHTPNCEVRLFGKNKCTCGAAEENYPTKTTNESTLVEAPLASEAEATVYAPVEQAWALITPQLTKWIEARLKLGRSTQEAAADFVHHFKRP